jgi:hypothetical protein
LRKSKEETSIKVNVIEVGTKEGIELGWSWGFELNEVGA